MKLLILPRYDKDKTLVDVLFIRGASLVLEPEEAQLFVNNRSAYAHKKRFFKNSTDIIAVDEHEVQGYVDRAMVGHIIKI